MPEVAYACGALYGLALQPQGCWASHHDHLHLHSQPKDQYSVIRTVPGPDRSARVVLGKDYYNNQVSSLRALSSEPSLT